MPRGRFVGYHGVGRDITARQQAQALLLRHNEALQRAVDERTRDLQQMNLDLDAFARQLAHELRTPIGQVQGLAQMLAERGGERLLAEDQELLQLQVHAAERMRETVDALLALARSTLQPMPLQALDLSALAHEVVGELPALPRQRAAALAHPAATCGDGQPGGAEDRAAQPDGQRREVHARRRHAARTRRPARRGRRARAHQRAGQRRGLRPGARVAAVQALRRLHARDDYAGSGIGLSIVQRIVERHGGRVEARAEPGRGAIFEFTLPCSESRRCLGCSRRRPNKPPER